MTMNEVFDPALAGSTVRRRQDTDCEIKAPSQFGSFTLIP